MIKGHVSVRRGKQRHSWYYKVYLGPDPHTGKRIFRVKSGFATKEKAQAAMNRFISARVVAQNCCCDGEGAPRGGLR